MIQRKEQLCLILLGVALASLLPELQSSPIDYRQQQSHHNASSIVYKRFVRRRPSWQSPDESMEEIIEQFYTYRKPPMGRLTDDELDTIIRCDFDPTLKECETLKKLKGPTRPMPKPVKPKPTTKQPPSFTFPTTPLDTFPTTPRDTFPTTPRDTFPTTLQYTWEPTAPTTSTTSTTEQLPFLPDIPVSSENSEDNDYTMNNDSGEHEDKDKTIKEDVASDAEYYEEEDEDDNKKDVIVDGEEDKEEEEEVDEYDNNIE